MVRAGACHNDSNTIDKVCFSIVSGERNDDRKLLECLQKLQASDPKQDLMRILSSKDELLEGSSSWVLNEDAAFTQWWTREDIPIMWIHGDPGKGKTMMMATLVDEVSRKIETSADDSDREVSSFFFCQSTEPRQNNASSVLRGLLYHLLRHHPPLLVHFQRMLPESAGEVQSHDVDIYMLWEILKDISRDDQCRRIYLIIDALDECIVGLYSLLELITRKDVGLSRKVKWLLSSRNVSAVTEHLDGADAKVHTSLELNSHHVSVAVKDYITNSLRKIAQIKFYDTYDKELEADLRNILIAKAGGTFLWAALVCKALRNSRASKARSMVNEYPKGLDQLYDRMMAIVSRNEDGNEAEICMRLLRVVALACRPLHRDEIKHFIDEPDAWSSEELYVTEIISLCGSFLTIRKDIIYFVHQSAKDYLITRNRSGFELSDTLYQHAHMTNRCLNILLSSLKENICGLLIPGTLSADIPPTKVEESVPAHIAYACTYWIEHLQKVGWLHWMQPELDLPTQIDRFFKVKFLNWLEVLSLTKTLPIGIESMQLLVALLQSPSNDLNSDVTKELVDFTQDANRFLLANRYVIEIAPLQTYSSALLFSPASSITRKRYWQGNPYWLKSVALAEKDGNEDVQLWDCSSWGIKSADLSQDDKLLLSKTRDGKTVIMDIHTGNYRQLDVRNSVFSPDGKAVAGAPLTSQPHGPLSIWETKTWTRRYIGKSYTSETWGLTISPGGDLIASGSENIVRSTLR